MSIDVLSSGSAIGPLFRTLALALAVSLSAAALGTAMAWLTIRTDLPARRVLAVTAPLPLVIPSFVGAAALQAAVAPNGMLDELVPALAGRLPNVDGFSGAWLVLTLFTYPYVYLPVAARLSGLPRSLEESARMLGRRPMAVFRTVVLPQASSAIWAGALLVFLYTVSDYGAVAALRYNTLTVEIFSSGIYNEPKAAGLGLVLAVVALIVVVAERAAAARRPRLETGRGRGAAAGPAGPLAVAGVRVRGLRAGQRAARAAVRARLLGLAGTDPNGAGRRRRPSCWSRPPTPPASGSRPP